MLTICEGTAGERLKRVVGASEPKSGFEMPGSPALGVCDICGTLTTCKKLDGIPPTSGIEIEGGFMPRFRSTTGFTLEVAWNSVVESRPRPRPTRGGILILGNEATGFEETG
jgi:hypothetical protein